MAILKPDVIVVGASSRALASSALRAGHRPLACDLFADADLSAICDSRRIDRIDYPGGLPDSLKAYSRVPAVYTGGLENHPDVIGRLEVRHPILGNPASVLASARSPYRLHRFLRERGLHSPDLSSRGDPPPLPEGWLLKPLRGSGGAGIRPAAAGLRDLDSGFYLQKRIPGVPASAIFAAGRRGTVLLGITRQLVGEPWLHAPPFAYCGSLGPIAVDPGVGEEILRAGDVVASRFHLRGLFGLDFIIRETAKGRKEAWVVELNPRFTAAVEVLEAALGIRAFEFHLQCFTGRKLPSPPPFEDTGPVAGKAILFAACDMTVRLRWMRGKEIPGIRSRLADVPHWGEPIRRRCPVVTLLNSGRSVKECLDALRRDAQAVERLVTSGPLRHHDRDPWSESSTPHRRHQSS